MLILPKHTVLRPEAALLVDGQHVADCLQCRHCQYTWIVKPGSGIRRGWCLRCGGPTCGARACDPCIPAERRLELPGNAA